MSGAVQSPGWQLSDKRALARSVRIAGHSPWSTVAGFADIRMDGDSTGLASTGRVPGHASPRCVAVDETDCHE